MGESTTGTGGNRKTACTYSSVVPVPARRSLCPSHALAARQSRRIVASDTPTKVEISLISSAKEASFDNGCLTRLEVAQFGQCRVQGKQILPAGHSAL